MAAVRLHQIVSMMPMISIAVSHIGNVIAAMDAILNVDGEIIPLYALITNPVDMMIVSTSIMVENTFRVRLFSFVTIS